MISRYRELGCTHHGKAIEKSYYHVELASIVLNKEEICLQVPNLLKTT
jgi:hypothetical protein